MKRRREKSCRGSTALQRVTEMPDDITYTHLSIRAWGGLWIFVSRKGVCGVCFGTGALSMLPEKILRRAGSSPRKADRCLASMAGEFERYLLGCSKQIPLPADLRGLTPFQRRVLQVVGRIPYGETRAYQWVARQVGQPAAGRAVGAACGANPVPLLIPCHRVIAKDGTLGGFSAGLPHKRRLLDLEQAHL